MQFTVLNCPFFQIFPLNVSSTGEQKGKLKKMNQTPIIKKLQTKSVYVTSVSIKTILVFFKYYKFQTWLNWTDDANQ